MIVGYDLGNACSQISYCFMEERGEEGAGIETLSSVAGSDTYNIPTVLCKRRQVNQWFYGREALRHAREEDGILVENLLELAQDGEPVQLDGESYDPVALLLLFLKRSLGLLSVVSSVDKIGAFLITCEKIDERMLEVLGEAAAGLGLKTRSIRFQSYSESFYHYMIHQPRELWAFQTVLLHYEQGGIRVLRMECNKRTTPVAVYIEEEEYPFLRMEPVPESEKLRRERWERMDRELLSLAEEICGKQLISSVYLIGDSFSEEWMKESLRYLCRNRRVFQGSNLYSKGACYGMMERLTPSEAGGNHVYLGGDKLKANVGMRVLRRGEDSYYALLDAGTNWFEAESTCECYIQEDNALELVITPLVGRNGKLARIILEGLNCAAARLRLRLRLKNENLLRVEIEDLGFGEFQPATHHVWTEEIEMY